MTRAAGDPSPSELAAYMAAVRQHENRGSYAWTEDYARSGHHGAYQIGTTEWLAWSAAAGVNPADHSPAAQDRVAAHQMTAYYRQFGSFRGVTIAWYGGPGRAAADVRSPGSVDHIGSPTIGQYVADINRLLAAGNLGTSPTSAGAPQGAASWNLPGTDWHVPGTGSGSGVPGAGLVTGATDALGTLGNLFSLLSDWDTWRRLLLVLGGAGLVLGGLSLAGVDVGGGLGGVASSATQIAKVAA